MVVVRALLKVLCVMCLLGALACSGGEERQAKYFERAQQFYDEGNYEKAKIEAKNVLQINPRHAQGRYLMALLEERKKNWKGMYSHLKLAIEEDPKFSAGALKAGATHAGQSDARQDS